MVCTWEYIIQLSKNKLIHQKKTKWKQAFQILVQSSDNIEWMEKYEEKKKKIKCFLGEQEQ